MALEARNRNLPDWFGRIRTGQITLPRIQRFESWDRKRVSTLLDTVLRGQPIGAALVLDVGEEPIFYSRPLDSVSPGSERITEQLLDGQQRITALWKALNDLYEDRTYFVDLQPQEGGGLQVRSVHRRQNGQQRLPLWADQPKEQLQRHLIPMRLLNPETDSAEIGSWCDQATDSVEDSRSTERRVGELQSIVKLANLPFLALPFGTPKHEAIDVFIKMNTTSVELKPFDILVAQMEAKTGESLHDLIDSLQSSIPAAKRYTRLSDLVLRVAALREGRSPTESSFELLDPQVLWDEWPLISEGIREAVEFLIEEHIFDRDRLPTVAVVPVLSAVWSQVPQAPDARGQARTLLRRYLWRSFFTNRYELAAATAALQDYRGITARVQEGNVIANIPIFDDQEHPIAEIEQLERAPWPRRRNTLARGILAIALRGGGRDFADDSPATWESLSRREYHHLFPAALLRDDGGLEDSEIDLALNCALVTWNTNRIIAAKEPVAYLKERVERTGGNQTLGENQIRHRVSSHTIPFQQLNVGGYSQLSEVRARSERISADYRTFLRARAEAIHKAAVKLCNGEEWHGLHETWC